MLVGLDVSSKFSPVYERGKAREIAIASLNKQKVKKLRTEGYCKAGQKQKSPESTPESIVSQNYIYMRIKIIPFFYRNGKTITRILKDVLTIYIWLTRLLMLVKLLMITGKRADIAHLVLTRTCQLIFQTLLTGLF